jgi:diacylglycerol kinase family enzyme
MKPVVGIIFNPYARINREQKNRQIHLIEEILGEKALVRVTWSHEDIIPALKEFKEAGIKIIGISGGDGTISSVVSAYINSFSDLEVPIIVPMKGGTMNIVANEVGIKTNQAETCIILSKYLEDGTVPIIEKGTIRITDLRYRHPRYAFSWADGLIYRFIKHYYKEGGGKAKALKLMFKTAFLYFINPNNSYFSEIKSKVYIDAEEIPFQSHLLIFSSSLEKTVFGFRVFKEKIETGENFGVLYAKYSFLQKSFYRIPLLLYFGINTDPSKIVISQIAKTLTVDGNRGYTFDGEVYDPDKEGYVKLEAGPKIKIISPKGKPTSIRS